MKVIGKRVLDELKFDHADIRSQVDCWIAEAEAAEWKGHADVKKRYAKASIVGESVVFDIKSYRIWTKIYYPGGTVLVKAAGTHDEYMKWKIK